jgi:hypothetical protein
MVFLRQARARHAIQLLRGRARHLPIPIGKFRISPQLAKLAIKLRVRLQTSPRLIVRMDAIRLNRAGNRIPGDTTRATTDQ